MLGGSTKSESLESQLRESAPRHPMGDDALFLHCGTTPRETLHQFPLGLVAAPFLCASMRYARVNLHRSLTQPWSPLCPAGKTSNMVNGFAPIPASTHAGGMAAGLGVTAKPTTQNLGLHGMSQADFEKKVDKEVTSRVAQAILATMRPLKRVLKEQQDKIDMLEHRHTDHAKTEARYRPFPPAPPAPGG